MADAKISALTAASTPLAGTEVLPVVQSGVTKKVSVADLTAGRDVNVNSLTIGGTTTVPYQYNVVTFGFTYNQIIKNYYDGANDKLEIRPAGSGNSVLALGNHAGDQLIVEASGNVKVKNNDLVIGVAGKGVVLTNSAGTVTKRVRLNDTGDGLVFENP